MRLACLPQLRTPAKQYSLGGNDSRPSPPMTIPYLDKLNPQQRRTVEHGGAALAEAGPLLIIAGAGSGKTNTLVHRVAHLIVSGARHAMHLSGCDNTP
jgi:hypothetical protein